jgi:hypothetical protein
MDWEGGCGGTPSEFNKDRSVLFSFFYFIFFI